MEILRYNAPGFAQGIRRLFRKARPAKEVEQTVRQIVEDIRNKGDQALFAYTSKFGGPKLTARTLKETRTAKVAPATARAIEAARANVHAFAKKSLRKDWQMRNAQGGLVGERFDAFQRVGIYVPGGTAPLVSTAVMTVTIAKAAGVEEIVVCTPADTKRKINDALLYALRKAGATEIYKVGGAQAIAAMAVGTSSIRAVQKIAGPGNAFVVEAKRQLFGEVAIDLLPGPSEVLVIADSGANPAWAAADLLAQAEHGKGSGMVLLTDSEKQLAAIETEIARQCAGLSRRDHLSGVIEKDAHLILVSSMEQAVEICNSYAPEHASLMTRRDESLAKKIRSAGALFLGGYSPVAVGDFLAGPSHTLPTGGGGKSFPGLMADMFQRRTSWVKLSREALKRSAPIVEAFSELEGLDAHGRSVAIRLAPKPNRKSKQANASIKTTKPETNR